MIEKIAKALYNARYLDAGRIQFTQMMFGQVFDYETLVERTEAGGIMPVILEGLRREAKAVNEVFEVEIARRIEP